MNMIKKQNKLDMNHNLISQKSFGFMDTVKLLESDSDVEYYVTGYKNDNAMVYLEGPEGSITVLQEKLVLVKNATLFQKDDIVKFTADAKFMIDDDIKHDIKQHYLPNTNHFSVLKVSNADGSLQIGNPNNFKDDGTGKLIGQCIFIQFIQQNQLELVTKKLQIRKMHGPEDTEITLFLPTSSRIHCTLDSINGIPDKELTNFDPESYTGTLITKEVKRQMIAKNLVWLGYKNRAWYSFDCIKAINSCIKKIKCTKYWKEKKNIRISRVIITDDLRFHPKNDKSAKYDWALVGNTQLNRNFVGLNRPLQPSNCISKKASIDDNLTDIPCELKISYDEEGNPVFNNEMQEEKNAFLQMIYKATLDTIEKIAKEEMGSISQATPVIPDNRVQTVEELPVATEVIPLD